MEETSERIEGCRPMVGTENVATVCEHGYTCCCLVCDQRGFARNNPYQERAEELANYRYVEAEQERTNRLYTIFSEASIRDARDFGNFAGYYDENGTPHVSISTGTGTGTIYTTGQAHPYYGTATFNTTSNTPYIFYDEVNTYEAPRVISGREIRGWYGYDAAEPTPVPLEPFTNRLEEDLPDEDF